jgi:hypothetical protein
MAKQLDKIIAVIDRHSFQRSFSIRYDKRIEPNRDIRPASGRGFLSVSAMVQSTICSTT